MVVDYLDSACIGYSIHGRAIAICSGFTIRQRQQYPAGLPLSKITFHKTKINIT